MARERTKAHRLQHLPEGLGLARRVFDELDAVQAERIRTIDDRLAIAGDGHDFDPASCAISSIACGCSVTSVRPVMPESAHAW